MDMEKARLNSNHVVESSLDDSMQSTSGAGRTARARLLRTPVDVAGQVLVTFRGVAVDENVVRYVQQRASELGLERAGTLHVLLLQDCPTSPYLAIVRVSVGADCYEHSAHADDVSLALRAALDALATADPRALCR